VEKKTGQEPHPRWVNRAFLVEKVNWASVRRLEQQTNRPAGPAVLSGCHASRASGTTPAHMPWGRSATTATSSACHPVAAACPGGPLRARPRSHARVAAASRRGLLAGPVHTPGAPLRRSVGGPVGPWPPVTWPPLERIRAAACMKSGVLTSAPPMCFCVFNTFLVRSPK
jgi:hypothetical protein